MTTESLNDALDREISWRKKELLSLRNDVAVAIGLNQGTLMRCLVTLCYAHWEGFIKRASRLYFDFILSQKHTYSELSDNLLAAAIARRAAEGTSKTKYYSNVATFLRHNQAEEARFQVPDDLTDNGMCNSTRLEQILYCLTMQTDPFELRYQWLDHKLIAQRNKVVHGEFTRSETEQLPEYLLLCDESLDLIELFRASIVGAASSRSYLHNSAPFANA